MNVHIHICLSTHIQCITHDTYVFNVWMLYDVKWWCAKKNISCLHLINIMLVACGMSFIQLFKTYKYEIDINKFNWNLIKLKGILCVKMQLIYVDLWNICVLLMLDSLGNINFCEFYCCASIQKHCWETDKFCDASNLMLYNE